MSKFTRTLKHEIVEAIPPAIFFFIAFHLLAFTQSLTQQQYQIEVKTMMNATIAALIVAKVILIADLLPFVNRFPNKPLIYNVVWKSLIYQTVALMFSYLEKLWEFYHEYGSVAAANTHMVEEVVWPHFWMIQIWMFVLFFAYSTLRELARALGESRMRQMFFGPLPGTQED